MATSYLDAFFAVAETLSFSKAARVLKISQPAVSRQIKLLEAELGQRLFARNRHQVALTMAGRALRERTLPAYLNLLGGLRQARGESQELVGPLRIGCLREAGPFVELAITFQKRHPLLQFQFEFLDNFEIFSALRDGQIDMGITTSASDAESMQSFHLYTQDSILVTKYKNERDIADFSNGEILPFVRYRFPSALHRDTESFFGSFAKKYQKELKNINLKIMFAVNSHRLMAEVLAENDFYAVMPHYFVQKFIRYSKLRRVSDYAISKKIYLSHMSSPHFEHRFRLFKAYLLEECRKIQRL